MPSNGTKSVFKIYFIKNLLYIRAMPLGMCVTALVMWQNISSQKDMNISSASWHNCGSVTVHMNVREGDIMPRETMTTKYLHIC